MNDRLGGDFNPGLNNYKTKFMPNFYYSYLKRMYNKCSQEQSRVLWNQAKTKSESVLVFLKDSNQPCCIFLAPNVF